MNKIIILLATGLRSGDLPKAPGTWGTLVSLLLVLFVVPELLSISPFLYVLTLLTFIVLSMWIADKAEKLLEQKDAPRIVIDEMAGFLVATFYLPTTWWVILLAFILFRAGDILKPFPVRWCQENLKGGVGIVFDDVVAGIYTCLLLHIVLLIL
ncbi:MAG: phosphatidylglycerophosphatase A [Deltaproteobacteria bacterium]|nr:phosphatidylglycerophosphatase A [Deltaproteobacteria bacterium]